MRGKLASIILLSLLVVGALVLAHNVQPIKASGTIYVRAGGSIDPPTVPTSRSIGVTAQDPPDWWPMFHHDFTHTGYSTSLAPTTNQTLWSYTTGGAVGSSPAVSDGVVYVGSEDNKTYALNATTGKQIWNYTTGDMVLSSPAVVGSMVYVGSLDGVVYALDAMVGAPIWIFPTGGPVFSSPAVAYGKVYVGSSDHKVYALDAMVGAPIWIFPTGNEEFSSPAVVSGVVYVGSEDDKVYALNATTGTLIWNYTTGSSVFSSPAVVGGMVYVGSYNDVVYALNAVTGAPIWIFPTGGTVGSSPAAADGKVYVGSNDGNVYALDAMTGAPIWSYATTSAVTSSPAAADGKVYVGSGDWNVYAFGVHDVAVTDVASPKTVVFQGFIATINVTVANQGGYAETFNVIAYANATAIQTETVTLASQNSTTLAFTWNTTGFAKGNYTLSAYAEPVPEETNTANNNFTDGWIVVSMVGDLTCGGHSVWDFVPDGFVDGSDLIVVARCFGSWPGAPPPMRWNANCDITNDGVVDGSDLIIVTRHFGETSP